MSYRSDRLVIWQLRPPPISGIGKVLFSILSSNVIECILFPILSSNVPVMEEFYNSYSYQWRVTLLLCRIRTLAVGGEAYISLNLMT